MLQNSHGEEVVRPVDVAMVQASSAQHQLAHRLCARAQTGSDVEFCYDLSGDQMLEAIKFSLKTAISVPIKDAAGGVPFVVVFLSSKLEQVGWSALSSAWHVMPRLPDTACISQP
jgi:hypothetical protein